ncbi:MAG: hypothetical protein WDZ51_03455 [Pirellulaceae bacterium]
MDDLDLVVSVATIIAVFLGPLFGVYVAGIYSRQENKRQEAARLFRLTNEHAQGFLYAFRTVHGIVVEQNEVNAQQNRQIEIHKELSQSGSRAFVSPSSLKQTKDKLDAIAEKLKTQRREVEAVVIVLNADVVSLGILFGDSGVKCGEAIRHLIVMYSVLDNNEVPTAEACVEELKKRVDVIGKEMKALHDSLRKSDPFDD